MIMLLWTTLLLRAYTCTARVPRGITRLVDEQCMEEQSPQAAGPVILCTWRGALVSPCIGVLLLSIRLDISWHAALYLRLLGDVLDTIIGQLPLLFTLRPVSGHSEIWADIDMSTTVLLYSLVLDLCKFFHPNLAAAIYVYYIFSESNVLVHWTASLCSIGITLQETWA